MIAESEGQRQAQINVADGEKQELIKKSEGEMQKRINEAKGKASEIEQIAKATAMGIKEISLAIGENHGKEAVELRIAEQYLDQFGKLASENNTMIIPQNMSDISGMIATATSVFKESKEFGGKAGKS